ncbi:unnamed protein product [Calicophoron daubneyi]|uniref:Importin N-terminal domain-containing protein n=1 Tax=Calicophoron daubneyi TaxID=300641 RepID=A0AAV2THY7_CALDB
MYPPHSLVGSYPSPFFTLLLVMSSPCELGDFEKLEKSIAKYFNGTWDPEFFQLIEDLQNSDSIWNFSWSLLIRGSTLSSQFFGAVLLKKAICSCGRDVLEGEHIHIRTELLNKLLELKHRNVPQNQQLSRKLFEVLSQLIFRAVDVWKSPLKCTLMTLGLGDQEHASVNQSTPKLDSMDCRSAENIVVFLSILMEEFNSTDFDFHWRQKIKQHIISEEGFVIQAIQQIWAAHPIEDMQANAVRCCSLWMSTLSSTFAVDDRINILEMIYNTVRRSELIYSVGLDCLITMFEEAGSGLSSDRDSVRLLDYHVSKLVELKPILDGLLEAHTRAVADGVGWDEFQQRELLSKTCLLLSTVADKQMEHLVQRIVKNFGSRGITQELFHMFLAPLTVHGLYPHDELVSDLGLQAWFNLIEYFPADNSAETVDGWECIRTINAAFLEKAFSKCKYPEDVDQFLRKWTAEERDQWYLYRTDLGDTILASYSSSQCDDYFKRLSDHFTLLVEHQPISEILSKWQDIEAIIFILTAISEQVIQRAHHGDHSACTLISEFVNYLSELIKSIHVARSSHPDVFQQHHLILFTGLTEAARAYTTSSLSSDEIVSNKLYHLWHHVVPFILDHLVQLSRAPADELTEGFKVSSIQALQTFIQETPYVMDHVDSIAFTICGVVDSQNLSSSQPNLLGWHCLGLALPYVPVNQSLFNLLQSRLTLLERCNPSDTDKKVQSLNTSQAGRLSSGDEDWTNQLALMLMHFVELLRGCSTTLACAESTDSRTTRAVVIPENCPLVMKLISEILMRVVLALEALAAGRLNSNLSSQFARLIQSGLSVPLSAKFLSHSDKELLYLCLEHVVRLLRHQLDSVAEITGSILDATWLVISRLTSDTGEHTLDGRPSGLGMSMQLLTAVLRRMDVVLTQKAREALTQENVEELVGFRPDMELEHPISPVLLALKAQEITDQVEQFAKFLHHCLRWSTQLGAPLAQSADGGLIGLRDRLIPDPSAFGWRLCFTVSLCGLCLPEWTTAERCIRLAETLFTLTTTASPSESGLALLIRPELLFEVHCSLLLVFCKGTLPRRLVINYAKLYASIAPLVPDKQFSLVCFILQCSRSVTSTSEWVGLLDRTSHQQALLKLVRQGVVQSNTSERERFARTVTCSSPNLSVVRSAITAFVSACSRTA